MGEKRITGSCLCGKVAYEITPPIKIFQYCHCTRCRKYTGSAHSAHIFVPPAQFKWLRGEEMISRFELPEAKYFATCFCKGCGSSLPWLIKTGKNVVVPAGTLDEDPGIRPIQNIFWQSRATWYVETHELTKYAQLPIK